MWGFDGRALSLCRRRLWYWWFCTGEWGGSRRRVRSCWAPMGETNGLGRKYPVSLEPRVPIHYCYQHTHTHSEEEGSCCGGRGVVSFEIHKPTNHLSRRGDRTLEGFEYKHTCMCMHTPYFVCISTPTQRVRSSVCAVRAQFDTDPWTLPHQPLLPSQPQAEPIPTQTKMSSTRSLPYLLFLAFYVHAASAVYPMFIPCNGTVVAIFTPSMQNNPGSVCGVSIATNEPRQFSETAVVTCMGSIENPSVNFLPFAAWRITTGNPDGGDRSAQIPAGLGAGPYWTATCVCTTQHESNPPLSVFVYYNTNLGTCSQR